MSDGGEATTKELKRSPKEVRVGHDEGEESSYAQSVLECAVSRERLFLRALRSVAWHSGYGAAVREGRPGAHSAPCESEGRCVACAHTLLPLLTGGMLFHFLFFWRFVHRVCRGQVRSIQPSSLPADGGHTLASHTPTRPLSASWEWVRLRAYGGTADVCLLAVLTRC